MATTAVAGPEPFGGCRLSADRSPAGAWFQGRADHPSPGAPSAQWRSGTGVKFGVRRCGLGGNLLGMGPLRPALQVRAGGWIDVPDRGTGRVRTVEREVGTVTVRVTLEGGWSFDLHVREKVLFWDT